MALLDDVKLLLDIPAEESDRDKKLNLIISLSKKQVLSHLPEGVGIVPACLEYIVCELAIARFNRIGNEGMSSYSQEGESITYAESDITPYLTAIEEWILSHKENTKGVVRFL